MSDFNPAQYGATFGSLLAAAPLNELGPGKPIAAMKSALDALASKKALEAAFANRRVADQDMANACLAALWLRFNFFDESHTISQEIHTSTGSFWHGILHRREPDYGNAKYWFHQVGNHPVYPQLNGAARELATASTSDRTAAFLTRQDEWDPFTFVDLVESVANKSSAIEQQCRQIQQLEWELLFDYCYQSAGGNVDP
jgi:hypothetical protein